ncbi:tRNA 2'-phosphotransferase 1-like isoform X2 [Tubulanus polymorphus]|uniref:tRNA 2'-phosphotransferase 1-like isoform X2 n=1 Tax=Tubulanus polymorphus TaxID=672921 RepID=UPI003DA6A352
MATASNQLDKKNLVRLSKDLSRILRHRAHDLGINIADDGYVYVDELLNLPHMKRTSFTEADIKHVVSSNDKQRFTLSTDESNGKLKIKANQGHSIQVKELALKKLMSPTDIPECIHGTYFKNWPSIKQQGLHRCNRTHIHFAAGLPGDDEVISGMRKSCQLIIYIDVEKAMSDGMEFHESSNKVILCAGNKDGFIEPKYFKKVIDRKGNPIS